MDDRQTGGGDGAKQRGGVSSEMSCVAKVINKKI